jgi:cyclophilin family peptidyl-prolyl cis-trans isomerase
MLAKRRLNKRPSPSTRFPAAIEALERRVLMSASPIITHATADNRGQTILQFSNGDLDANTVNANTISVYTAGPSGNPANSDHVLQPSTVAYQSVTNVVTITANLPLNTPYEVVVRGSQIENIGDTAELDGEFNGARNPSGNGVQGGTYRFVTSIASSKTAVFYPSDSAAFEVALASKSQDNVVVSNFLKYANAGLWDGTLINLDQVQGQNGSTIGIFQAGQFNLTTPNGIGLVPNLGNITPTTNDFTNVAYTLSMRTVNGVGSNAFFFNAVNNPSLDSSQGGGPFDAFGELVSSSNTVVQDSFLVQYNTEMVDLSNRQVVKGNPQLAGLHYEFTSVPTTGNTSVAQVAYSLAQSTLIFTRIAIESAVSAAITTPFIGASVRPAVAASNLQYAPTTDQSAPVTAGDGGGNLLDAADGVRLML